MRDLAGIANVFKDIKDIYQRGMMTGTTRSLATLKGNVKMRYVELSASLQFHDSENSIEWQQTSRIAAIKRKNKPSWSAIKERTYQTAIDTGATLDSIGDKIVSQKTNVVKGIVSAGTKYSQRIQEGGVYEGSPVPPRPIIFAAVSDADYAAQTVMEALP